MFDKRGTGMSDRVPDLPGLDQRMDDLRAVMKAADMEEAELFGRSEGGPMTTLFAATYWQQCRALVFCGCFARFATSWVPTEEQFLDYVEHAWGTGGSLPFFAPSRANDPIFQRWRGRFERLGASPAAAKSLVLMNMQIDISDILSTIRVTHSCHPPHRRRVDRGRGWTLYRPKYSRRALYGASGKRPPTLRRRQR